MDPVRNPYAPGDGRTPAALVGRDRHREAWRRAMDRVELGRGAQPLVLHGTAGTGKTVLLEELRRAATERNWLTAYVSTRTGTSLRKSLGEALYPSLREHARPTAGYRMLRALKTALSFKASYESSDAWQLDVDLEDSAGGGADTGVLEADLATLLRDLARAALEERVGLGILIDDAQDLPRDALTALSSVARSSVQDDWGLGLVLAGFPSLPLVVLDAAWYADWLYSYQRLEPLDEDASREALVVPARERGVEWDDDALAYVAEQAGGHPYFLQQFGHETWNRARSGGITLDDAEIGVERGKAVLDTLFFRPRWARASPTEQRYLRAMALDGDAGSMTGEVSARLGKTHNSLGPTRARLLAKRLVYTPERGAIAFTMPGMAEFIRRQPEY